MLVGITGGIGSGKTTLSNLFRAAGYLVYDSDKEARRLQNEHLQIKTQIQALFGDAIYTAEGLLNRAALAVLVFGNRDLLLQLNAIVHPVVKEDIVRWKLEHAQHELLFIESAILFESGFDYLVDKVLLVTASEALRTARIIRRDGITPEQVHARMSNQLPEEEKMKWADLIISSDDNLLKETQVATIVDKLLLLR
jgi:dephospho-CoA kinase